MLLKILGAVVDLILPKRCAACGALGMILCEKCAGKRELADPLDDPEIHALFAYRDPIIRKMIWSLKYKGATESGKILGQHLYHHLMEELSETTTFRGGDTRFLIIPIPLSPQRTRERGYNQALLIAHGFTESDKPHLELATDILERTRDTDSQTAITERTKRLSNLRGAFRVTDPAKVRGKQIIVIDDVVTTGGTLNEARRVLKDAGASGIILAAVAH